MPVQFELRGVVALENPVVVATSGRPSFLPLEIRRPGELVRIGLDVAPDDIEAIDARWRQSKPDDASEFWLNTTVDRLHVGLELSELSEDDYLRLEGRHPTAKRMTLGLQADYQEAAELGSRVGTLLSEVLADLARILRVEFGQFWVRPVPLAPDPYLDWGPAFAALHAEWRIGNGEWRPFRPSLPHGFHSRITLNAWNQYLSPADWDRIGVNWERLKHPNTAFALLAEARESFENGESQLAIIHLSSALEWAVQRFLKDNLGPLIPEASLKTILKQSYSRLLDDWVLPLSIQKGLNLKETEWTRIKHLQEMRRTAAHPAPTKAWRDIEDKGFLDLWYAGLRTIWMLLGIAPSKIPPDALASGSTRGGWLRGSAASARNA